MNRFTKVFTRWHLVLLLFFAAANLAGTVRPRGLLPFRTTGFPFTFATWGVGIDEFMDWHLLGLNAIVAFVAAGIVASVLTWLRCRSASVVSQAPDAEPSAAAAAELGRSATEGFGGGLSRNPRRRSPPLDRAILAAALAKNSLADSQFSTCNRLASRIEKHSCEGCSARTSAALRFLY